MNTPYQKMPSSKQWLADSSTMLTTRKQDVILTSIDALVEAYEKAPVNVKQVVCVDLFWSLDYWLKIFKTNSKIDARRDASIHRLYVYTATELCRIFGCQVNMLVNKLEFAFGRTVGEHGLRVDVDLGWVRYMGEAERKLYQLKFSGGLAYQYQWWYQPANIKQRVLANSHFACDESAFFSTGADKRDFGGFVMTMGRDIYMARHGGANDKNSRIFHSSYLGNTPVACAGTMLIRNGQIEKVCPDSGHFQPGDINVLMLLQTLRMLQVDLRKVMVQDYLGKDLMWASQTIEKNDWNAVLKHMANNTKLMKENQANRRDLEQPFTPSTEPVKDGGYGYDGQYHPLSVNNVYKTNSTQAAVYKNG